MGPDTAARHSLEISSKELSTSPITGKFENDGKLIYTPTTDPADIGNGEFT